MTGYSSDYFNNIYDKSGEAEKISQIRAKMLMKRGVGLKRVLDIGCGYGYFLQALQEQGIKVLGVDFSKKAIEVAKHGGVEVNRVDVSKDKLPFQDNNFDAVTMFDLLEHFREPELVLKEAFRVMKPGGLLFLTTPNNQGWLREIIIKIFPDDPTHVNVKGKGYWKSHLEAVGFSRIKIDSCILHGFPPHPYFRRIWSLLRLPVYRGPVFFPVDALCGYLYITGYKIE